MWLLYFLQSTSAHVDSPWFIAPTSSCWMALVSVFPSTLTDGKNKFINCCANFLWGYCVSYYKQKLYNYWIIITFSITKIVHDIISSGTEEVRAINFIWWWWYSEVIILLCNLTWKPAEIQHGPNILCFSALTDVGYGALNLKLMLSNDYVKLISPALHCLFIVVVCSGSSWVTNRICDTYYIPIVSIR